MEKTLNERFAEFADFVIKLKTVGNNADEFFRDALLQHRAGGKLRHTGEENLIPGLNLTDLPLGLANLLRKHELLVFQINIGQSQRADEEGQCDKFGSLGGLDRI